MEKITEKIANIPGDGNYFSLEFFPPKTQMVVLPYECSFSLAYLDSRDSQIYKFDLSVCPAFLDHFS